MSRDKIRRFLAFRADVEVRVQINAMPFHAGRLLMSWVPGYKYIGAKQEYYSAPVGGVATNNQYLPAITGCPHVDIDLSTCTEGNMCLPFISPYYFTNLTNGIGSMGMFQLVIYSPLVGATPVDVTVFMNFKNIELRYPTGLPLSATAQIGAEANDVASPGVIESTSATTSEVLGKIQDIPSISSFVRPALWVSNAVNDVAKRFGWSKPLSIESVSATKLTTTKFMGNYDGMDNSHPMGFSAVNELQQEPSLFRTNVDEMSLSHVLRTPTYYTHFTWSNTAQPQGFALHISPVNPTQYRTEITASPPLDAPTMVAYVAHCFRYWRGGINFHFKFVKTKFHSGRVRIVYVPGDNSSGTTFPANTDVDANYSTVVDLRSDTDVTFNIPYVAIQQWMTIDNSQPTSDNNYQFSTGRLYVVVLNELRAAAAVSNSIDVIVEVSAASDFELAIPCTPTVYPADASSPPTLAVASPVMAGSTLISRMSRALNATAQVGEAEGIIAPTEVIQSSGMVNNPIDPKLHPSTSFNPTALSIGEKVSSIRQLVKRFNLVLYDSTSAEDNYTTDAVIQPDYVPNPLTGATRLRYVDYYSYFSYLFAFYRGGFRFKWTPMDAGHPNNQYTAQIRMITNRIIITPTDNSPIQTNVARPDNQLVGASVWVPMNLEGCVEFQAPYYSKYSILPSLPGNTILQDLYSNNTISLTKFSVQDQGAHGMFFRAAADDFSFGQLLGPPRIATYTSPSKVIGN
nr:MAG: hypothetical protein 2 [Cripavirus sp.]